MHYFSPSEGAFYSEALHGARVIEEELSARAKKAGKRPKMVPNPDCQIPADAVEITDDRWQALIAGQAEGKEIIVRNGLPALTERRVSDEVKIAGRRRHRDQLLAGSDWTQLADALPGKDEIKAAWAAYRQQLRDIDLLGDTWPVSPDGVVG